MIPHPIFFFAWLIFTVAFSITQSVENRRHGSHGRYWAPVWWIALTWPWWMMVGLVRVGTGR